MQRQSIISREGTRIFKDRIDGIYTELMKN